MKRIRVLIVEDSAVITELLRHCIGLDSRLEVCAAVSSAEEALGVLDRVAPDVISLDIHLPGINGLEATRRIMSRRPTPIVVVSASAESEELKISMKALAAGALAVLEKPVGVTHEDYAALAERLCTQLAIMSKVKVLRQHGRARIPSPAEPAAAGPQAPDIECTSPSRLGILGIASSTGGPGALVELLRGLGSGFRLPILIVQHMTPGFLKEFASWLESVCPFPVAVARGGETPSAGHIYIAPVDRHLVMSSNLLKLEAGVPVCAQRPSGTVLFQSLARSLGPRSFGVVLTGMGEDGAAGLLEMRKAGGYTIAEDRSTAVVYGMPGAAVRIGAAVESLPLQAIAPRLLQLISGAPEALKRKMV